MRDFSAIRKIQVVNSGTEANRLLAEDWTLMEISRDDYGPLFILGKEFDFGEICRGHYDAG